MSSEQVNDERRDEMGDAPERLFDAIEDVMVDEDWTAAMVRDEVERVIAMVEADNAQP